MSERYILALDQGTTSSRAIAFDHAGRPVASAQQEFEQRYPAPGHVTHDPEAIWSSQLAVAREVVGRIGGAESIVAIGVTNQRETTVIWDRATSAAVADAIVWQSRITAPFCEELRAQGHEATFRERTGLPLDAYFSGPKIRHILDAQPGLRIRAERGELAFGTVDSFLVWRLSGGRAHVTDVSNASRTLLFDIRGLAWDDELLSLVEVPAAVLPTVVPSSGVVGETNSEWFGRPIPIAAIAGDQQAATFGQACFEPGQAKNTYGTGAFLLRNTGDAPVASRSGLLTTVAWQLGRNEPATYALEGSVFIAGAAVQWLRDGLKAIGTAADIEALAAQVPDSDGVVFVPAFVGLGAPHWDPDARGLLIGLTRGTTLAHIARATLNSIALQVRDVLEAMNVDAGGALTSLRVDGGAASNDSLLQLQADVVGVSVERPEVRETTALGAAYLAGLATEFWHDLADITSNWRLDRRFEPRPRSEAQSALLRDWRRAIDRARGWADSSDADQSPRSARRT